jgi:hypothetical protein
MHVENERIDKKAGMRRGGKGMRHFCLGWEERWDAGGEGH